MGNRPSTAPPLIRRKFNVALCLYDVSLEIRSLGETVCLMCRLNPKQGDRQYCGKTCAEEAANKGPVILEVPEGHVTFSSGKKNICLFNKF